MTSDLETLDPSECLCIVGARQVPNGCYPNGKQFFSRDGKGEMYLCPDKIYHYTTMGAYLGSFRKRASGVFSGRHGSCTVNGTEVGSTMQCTVDRHNEGFVRQGPFLVD